MSPLKEKREQNIKQPQIEKKEFLNYKTYHPLLKSNVLDSNKRKNELFEGMKKAWPLSRFVKIMGKSKYRKESKINKARELPENILAKSAQFNINKRSNKKILTYLQNLFYLKLHLLKIFIKKLKNSKFDIWYQQRQQRLG